jgi:hypothetical protein
MLSCPVLKFQTGINFYAVFSSEFVTNTPEINIGGTATKELDLYENKTVAEM